MPHPFFISGFALKSCFITSLFSAHFEKVASNFDPRAEALGIGVRMQDVGDATPVRHVERARKKPFSVRHCRESDFFH